MKDNRVDVCLFDLSQEKRGPKIGGELLLTRGEEHGKFLNSKWKHLDDASISHSCSLLVVVAAWIMFLNVDIVSFFINYGYLTV